MTTTGDGPHADRRAAFRGRSRSKPEVPQNAAIILDLMADAYVYKRMSTHEQRRTNTWSLLQQDELEALARRVGYDAPLDDAAISDLKADPTYPGRYTNGRVHVEERDLGRSGTKNHSQRPGLAALIAAIEADVVKTVIVVHISRLYRDQTLIDAMTFADLCKRHGVVILTPSLTLDLRQDWCFEMYKLEVENAARELKVMRMRLYENKLLKARHGLYDGRGIAWGYTLDVDKGSVTYQKPVPHEPHAEVVREMFRLGLREPSARRLRQQMLERGIAFPPFPPALRETLGGRHCAKSSRLREDGSWVPTTKAIASILTNPIYIGWWLVQGEVAREDNHPAIVGEETFWRVQETWGRNAARGGGVGTPPAPPPERDAGRRALLTGRLYCGEHPDDGSRSRHYLTANYGLVTKDGRQQSWYLCDCDYDDDARRRACFHTRQDVLDDAVVGHVLARVRLAGLAREVTRQREADHGHDRDAAQQHRTARKKLEGEVELLKGKLPWSPNAEHHVLMLGEILDRERQIKALSQQIAVLSRQRSGPEGHPTAPQVAEVEAFLRTLPYAWPRVRHETRRKFLGLLLQRVTVYHDGSDVLHLHVCWRAGPVDVLRAHRANPPRPEGWRWEPWEDDAIRARYPTCANVADLLSRVRPHRNWSGVKKRAQQLGVRRTLARPPVGVADHSAPAFRKDGSAGKAYEWLGTYNGAERPWPGGRGAESSLPPGTIRNVGTGAASRTGASP